MDSHKAALLFSMLLFSLFMLPIEARDIMVGGKTNAWKIPSSESESLNKWAEASRFRVGDSLVWNYDANKDSVLHVTEKDYEACNTSSPLAAYNDGNTKVKLNRSGPYYFISGAKGHCEEGQKLVTVVLSPKRRGFIGISPAPAPVDFEGPAVAPTSNGMSLRSSLMVIFVGLMGLALFQGDGYNFN